MEKGLWLVKHTRTLLSSGLRLIVVVVVHPSFLAPLVRSFPSSRLRSQIKDRAGVLTHVRYDAVADGPLRFVRSFARSLLLLPRLSVPSSPLSPGYLILFSLVATCLLASSGYPCAVSANTGERERKSSYRKSGCCSASRTLVSRITARARARDSLPVCYFSSSLFLLLLLLRGRPSCVPCSLRPGRIFRSVLPFSRHIICVHVAARHDAPVTFYFPCGRKRG